jgi:hypothetical protein
MFRYLGASLAFGIAGAALWRMDNSSPYPWLGFMIFVFGTYASGRQLLNRRPRITIDDRGVIDRTLRYGLIEWNDIDGAYLLRKPVFGIAASFICLQLRDAKKYTDRLPPTARRLVGRNARAGATPVSLNVIGVDTEPEEILSVIDRELHARSKTRAVV